MKSKKSVEQLLEEMNEKLDKLIAISSIQGKGIDIQIRILKSYGFAWDEIGKFTGLTADAARKRFERS